MNYINLLSRNKLKFIPESWVPSDSLESHISAAFQDKKIRIMLVRLSNINSAYLAIDVKVREQKVCIEEEF